MPRRPWNGQKRIADEYGLEMWLALGRIYRGWATSAQGEAEEGIREFQRGLTAYDATGGKLWRAPFLGLMAKAFGRARRLHEALTAVTEALALVRETGENCSAAELYRIPGDVLTMQAAGGARGSDESHPSPLDEASSPLVARAEASFNEALSIARQQQARSWELRAATSLGRLYLRQGKRDRARRIVTSAHDLFAEAGETADVKAAREVLNSLSRGPTPESRTGRQA